MENVEKITWRFGEPETWPSIFESGEIPFKCLCCCTKTAEFKATMPDRYAIVNALLCRDCVKLKPAEIMAMMEKGG